MSEIIDSTYEIIGELGAGGGGVVYLANHLRLGKKVVLKADKRNVSTRAVLLRREVDILKELRHTYIPQVYDYFIEDDTSYTVMDYVDGESLDRVLKREGSIPQPTVIRWARQLLEALSYLHSPTHGDPPRGYIHSDIKPGNIMLRPNGDICLIDFNISLAIGIENIVGRSAGYSSPEHYGLDYSLDNEDEKTELIGESTTDFTNEETELAETAAGKKSTSSSSGVKSVTVLDARSDIYSVGATLYHLLSGKRPAAEAVNVEKLSYKQFSPLLVDIITKAMQPNPNLRFKSADEMLSAINGLWTNDPRVKRQKRQLAVTASVLSVMLLAGGAMVFTGLRQMERIQAGKVLAASSAEALSAGDIRGAVDKAMEALVDDPGLFDIPYTAEAQLALTNALGVYDLSDSFKPAYAIELASAPFKITKSPDETMLLAFYAYEIAIYRLETGELIKTLPTVRSALCEAEFLSDSKILYSGEDGLTAYDIASDTVLWTAEPAVSIAVSEDGMVAAAVSGSSDVINFYDTETGELISLRRLKGRHLNIPENDRFADVGRTVFEMNFDGSLCAVSLDGGGLMVLDIFNINNDIIIFNNSEHTYFDGNFVGDMFAFSAAGGSESELGIIDCTAAEYAADMSGRTAFRLCQYNGGLYVSQNDIIVEFDVNSFEQTKIAYTENKNILAYDISEKFVISAADDRWSVFCKGAGIFQSELCDNAPDFVLITDEYAVLADRDSPVIQILRLETDSGESIIEYDPSISHYEARLSADRSSVMLFDINGFTIVNADGSIRNKTALPEPEKIYDQQYRDGALEVTYYSGKTVSYSAKTGELISEKTLPPPDESLDVEYETDSFIVKAPLHGAPTVYDKSTGNEIAELKGDDHLTYITELDSYLLAQYISTDGMAYGVLMNKSCEPIANMPYLCDISGDMAVFDLPSGKIKLTPLYNCQSLKEMADNYGN